MRNGEELNLMKKIIILICICSMVISLSSCAKKCFECGERTSRGYTILGNYYCEDCVW